MGVHQKQISYDIGVDRGLPLRESGDVMVRDDASGELAIVENGTRLEQISYSQDEQFNHTQTGG